LVLRFVFCAQELIGMLTWVGFLFGDAGRVNRWRGTRRQLRSTLGVEAGWTVEAAWGLAAAC